MAKHTFPPTAIKFNVYYVETTIKCSAMAIKLGQVCSNGCEEKLGFTDEVKMQERTQLLTHHTVTT